MREPVDDVKPGQEVESALTWAEPIPEGARVEATDGFLGTVKERRTSEGADIAFLGVDTDQGLVYLPEQLVRETRGDTVYLSLPAADVRAQSSAQMPHSSVRPSDAR